MYSIKYSTGKEIRSMEVVTRCMHTRYQSFIQVLKVILELMTGIIVYVSKWL